MGDVFIFDIDGCIMPNVFPLITESKKDDENINQEIVKRASDVSLFPEFIEFYKKNCNTIRRPSRTGAPDYLYSREEIRGESSEI